MRFLRMDGGSAVYSVGSGAYTFRSVAAGPIGVARDDPLNVGCARVSVR